MKFTPPLQKGRLVKRYKRFLADVLLPDGTTVTVHCPNSGSMKGLVAPGNPVWISESPNLARRLRHTLEIIEVRGVKVGVNTQNPNLLVREALESGLLGISFRGEIRREVKYGANSRIDFLLEDGAGIPLYVEVKNVTLKEGNLALFPDSVTERGKKHLEEMMNVVKEGGRALMVYTIQRSDCEAFSVAEDIDPKYAETLKKACAAGVEVCAYQCHVDKEEIRVDKPIGLRIFE
jgi:sugar fermentation stimulation protein A